MSPPTPREIATATRPTVSDTRPPSTSRSRTSRPKPSVPSRWPSVPGGSSESRRLCLNGSMAMASGTAYDTRSSRPNSASAPMPTRSRLKRHHARRYGPAGFTSLGSRRRSATTADTSGARGATSGRRIALPDAGVQEAIAHIDEQIRDDVRDRGEQDDALYDGVVLRIDRIDRQLADALAGEDGLDDDASGEQASGLEADDRDDRDERVPHRVAQDDRAAGETFRPRGADVLEAHHLEERRAREARDESHAFVAQDDGGQDEPVEAARARRRQEPEEHREHEDEEQREGGARDRDAAQRHDHHHPVERRVPL